MADLELRGIECAAWVPAEVDLPIQEQGPLPNLLVYLTRKAQIRRPGTHSNARELYLLCSCRCFPIRRWSGRISATWFTLHTGILLGAAGVARSFQVVSCEAHGSQHSGEIDTHVGEVWGGAIDCPLPASNDRVSVSEMLSKLIPCFNRAQSLPPR